jgi:hypothetical protein
MPTLAVCATDAAPLNDQDHHHHHQKKELAMTGWVTVNSTPEHSTSNLTHADAPHKPRYEVGRGGIEVATPFDGGESRVTSNPSTTYQAGQDRPTTGPIMDTVRASHGGELVGRMPNGKDRVTIGGMETRIEAAVAAKILVRNPDGSFSEKTAPAPLTDPAAEAQAKAPAAETQGQPEGEPEGVSFGEAGDAAMADLLKGQTPGDLYKTLDSVLHHGDMDKATIGRMASMAGVEPEAMEAQVTTVWQGAHDAASDFLADAGIEDGDAFAAFITSDPHRRADMIEAARNYFLHHRTEGLQTMADAYLPQMDRYESARVRDMLTEAGYQFNDRPGGGIDVLVHGSPVSWEVAVKQKIVTFSRG